MADSIYKVLILGEVKVGKTSLQIYEEGQLQERYIPTVGIDFSIRTHCIDEKIIRLQLYDTSGSEKYRSLLTSYCRAVHGIIIVYDVTNRETFDKVVQRLEFVQKYCSDDVQLFLVGNKTDLSERKVTQSEGEALAKKLFMEYFETSAKDGESITSMFNSVAKNLLIHVESEGLRRHACGAPRPARRSAACAVL